MTKEQIIELIKNFHDRMLLDSLNSNDIELAKKFLNGAATLKALLKFIERSDSNAS